MVKGRLNVALVDESNQPTRGPCSHGEWFREIQPVDDSPHRPVALQLGTDQSFATLHVWSPMPGIHDTSSGGTDTILIDVVVEVSHDLQITT